MCIQLQKEVDVYTTGKESRMRTSIMLGRRVNNITAVPLPGVERFVSQDEDVEYTAFALVQLCNWMTAHGPHRLEFADVGLFRACSKIPLDEKSESTFPRSPQSTGSTVQYPPA